MNRDFLLASYDYELPEKLIAQYPPANAGDSRLMLVSKDPDQNDSFPEGVFADLARFLPENALLVANNSRVTPARTIWRDPDGGKREFLLLTPPALIDENNGVAECLLKPARKFGKGKKFSPFPGAECEVLNEGEYGKREIRVSCDGNLDALLEKYGSIPLPPYIKRASDQSDAIRYQTVWASRRGSIAAPTAGLHFNEDILSSLGDRGIERVEVTLHVGYGTFSPARCDNIKKHVMHPEYAEIGREAAAKINRAKEEKRPVIAIGTTSLRVLEGVAASRGKLEEFGGWINLFVYPGFQFRIIDGLITNFHLPKSTLLMLAAALAGREKILAAYKEAIRREYRFFSYGDAMLIY
ncbi:MAG: tRNA preQ1(34) S-adenosylmethionine ribosyltransferase-isomerase QueA [Desulfovibrio sp.]|nr:tRNA preQ1(34) S-adenosylmethionine ribosyltransferase-isomerase QueA [Desulfovibrio sp.]